MENEIKIPVLSAEQIRVLGALMEKAKTTPDYYPMTMNGLVSACNQKTSRKPVVNYDEETIGAALNSLKIGGLISTSTGGSSRATKYKHNFAIVYPILPSEVAVMCLLFLRGPQTPGEINTNSGRLYEFETLEEVNQTLDKLAGEGYLKQLPKRPGQKEQRYAHLFAGDVAFIEDDFVKDEMTGKSNSALEERVVKLETELAELKESLAKLMAELGVE
ncbi:YceH family protein [Pedobacter sp. SL55]|uniref:YceH family protein n=1 Tax=Pedobacter sp. SL55 TaxID=2995161 RepID=UPI00226F419E|nr:YceH family protein [Pedobacter sp. SL55]WAC40047.1 YceH family protein [Pedobacter sp. SL55]